MLREPGTSCEAARGGTGEARGGTLVLTSPAPSPVRTSARRGRLQPVTDSSQVVQVTDDKGRGTTMTQTGTPRRRSGAAPQPPAGAWHTEITAYTEHLRVDLGRAPGTVRLRRHHLARFARDAGGRPGTVSTQTMLAWLASHRWGPEARKSAQASLRSFYGWALLTGRVERDPAKLLPPVKIPRTLPRPIPDPVIRAALEHATLRERHLVLLAGEGALRAAEMARVHTLDLLGDQLLVHGKGGRERVVPILNPELRAAILAADGHLFPGRVDGHLSAQYVSVVLSRLLPGHWTGHKLRHRALTVAYDATRDVRAVQEFAGHASVTTTQRYTLVSGAALQAVAQAAILHSPTALQPPESDPDPLARRGA